MEAVSVRRFLHRLPQVPWSIAALRSAGRGLPAALGFATARTTFVALLVLAVLYRVRLGLTLGDTFASEVPQPLRAVLRQLGADTLFCLGVAALVFLFAQLGGLSGLFTATGNRRIARPLLGLGYLLLLLGLLLCGVLAQTQHGVFFSTGNGLTAELLRESLELNAIKEVVSILSPLEHAVIFCPLVVFLLLRLAPPRLRQPVERGLSGLGGLPPLVALLLPAAPLPEALLHHPVAYVLVDAAHHSQKRSLLGEANAAANRDGQTLDPTTLLPPDDHVGSADEEDEAAAAWLLREGGQLPSMALTTPPFVVDDKLPKKTLPVAAGKRPYHILYIVMESTGFDLALRSLGGAAVQRGDDVAMPFLRSLSSQGYFLANHYASGNSSPRGIFSLLSGLYVMPEVAIFDVSKNNYLPSLVSYLGPRYRSFLVTPGSLDWYFPQGFLLHSGMSELWGYHALPIRKTAPGGRAHARDEAESVSFFLRRLDEQLASGQPVLSVYYSFVAHWPYPDYGPPTHVTHPGRPQNAYCNNLRYLDQQIERIYKHLQARGVLDDTIVILAGDHGEAFGQHPHNYTHSRMSFNENVRTPALLLNAGLFPPRVFTQPTSHVDVLPTLLDALGLSYDETRLQGESLFRQSFRRKYIFFYGNEDTLSSVSAQDMKLQLALRDGSCWAFNLRADPEERHRVSCSSTPALKEQQQATLLYRRHQGTALRRYNQLAKRGLPPLATPRTPLPVAQAPVALAPAALLAGAVQVVAAPTTASPVVAAPDAGSKPPAEKVHAKRKGPRKVAVEPGHRRTRPKVTAHR
jgi:hypothetical protein